MERKEIGIILTIALLLFASLAPMAIGASPIECESSFGYDKATGHTSIVDEYDVCEDFTIAVNLTGALDVYATSIIAEWDPAVLECDSPGGPYGGITNGSFLLKKKTGALAVPPGQPSVDNTIGKATHGHTRVIIVGEPESQEGVDGDGTIYYIDFHVKAIGETWINLTVTLADPEGTEIEPTTMENVWFKLSPPPPPPAEQGTVTFTEDPLNSPGQPPHTVNNNTDVTFTASTTKQAYNNFTDTHCSATLWNWTLTTSGYSVSYDLQASNILVFTFNIIGEWQICLTGYFPCMNESQILTAGIDWQWSAVVCQNKSVALPAAGTILDLYTETQRWCGSYETPFIGAGPNFPADAYTVDEEVTLYVNLTHNEGPLQSRLIAFEVHDPSGEIVLVRSAYTDENGVATISFRIVTVCGDPEYAFGKWSVIAKTKVCEHPVNDTLQFDCGWLINIEILDIGWWDTSACPGVWSWIVDLMLGFPPGFIWTNICPGLPGWPHKDMCECLAWLGLDVRGWDLCFDMPDLLGLGLPLCPVKVVTNELKVGQMVVVNFNITNIAMIPRNATFSFVIYDDNGVPIANNMISAVIPPEEFCHPNEFSFWWLLYIPKWAYCGKGTLYANAFTDLPTECGVSYCPEQKYEFQIKWDP